MAPGVFPGVMACVNIVSFKRIMLVRPRSRCGWGFMFAPVAINLEYIAANILDVVDEVEVINYEFDEVPLEDYLKEHNPDLFGVTLLDQLPHGHLGLPFGDHVDLVVG